ncbi:MAG: hypothetical protein HKL90_13800 [Elusimicrobia bacterium]|nr:hypothetical protein [Elusimicrobiota bacterium]
MVMDSAQFRRGVEEAFAATPYPGDDGLVIHNENCEECAEVLAKYKGKRWLDYKDRPLSLIGPPIRESCLFFTPQAFRYYAPLIMLASAESFDDADLLTDYFINSLTPTNDRHAPENAARLAAFAPAELQMLRLYLVFLKAAHPQDYTTSPRINVVSPLEKAITARLEGANSREDNPPPRSEE